MHFLVQLYMAMHVREGNSDRLNQCLFELENADCPPSLSKSGVLISGQKSDFDFDEDDAKLIDVVGMVHLLTPDATFKPFRC